MHYLSFIQRHPRRLLFGFSLNLFSNFGQTFVVSLFVPYLLEEFHLTPGAFGSIYSAATLLSAAALPLLGGLLDRTDLKKYSIAVMSLLGVAGLGMASANNVWLLFVSVFGLRMAGQGLLSHTASVSMATFFHSLRGKALAIAGLGFPLGEAVLPASLPLLIDSLGWRQSWLVIAGLIFGVLIPLMWVLLKNNSLSRAEVSFQREASRPWIPRFLFRDPAFYLLLPGMLCLPFVLTGLFLYQLRLFEWRGWAPALLGLAFVGFASGRLIAGFIAGHLVDRFGACRVYGFYLFPVLFTFAGFLLEAESWIIPLCYFLAGTSQGAAGAVKSAVWAEVYGTASLGSIRSLASSLMVLSTAAGPLVFGAFLNEGISFAWLLWLMFLVIGVCLISTYWFSRRIVPYQSSVEAA